MLLLGALMAAMTLSSVAAQKGPTRTVFAFIDLTEETGLDSVYNNGAAGEYYFPEITGGGVAFLDFDGDGLLGPSRSRCPGSRPAR